MTFRTCRRARELLCPFLSSSAGIGILQHLDVFRQAVVVYVVVIGRVGNSSRNAQALRTSIENLIHRLVRDSTQRRVQRAVVALQQCLHLPENHLVLVFSQRSDASLADGERTIRNDLVDIYQIHVAQSLAARAPTLRRVEREIVGSRIGIAHARGRTHQPSGIVAQFTAVGIQHHHQSVAHLQAEFHTLAQSLGGIRFPLIRLDHDPVHHHLYGVVDIAVNLHPLDDFHQFAVHPHPQESLASDAVEEFAIMSLAVPHQRSQQQDSPAGIVLAEELHDLLLGIFHHRLARSPGIGITGTRIEKTQVIIDLRGRSDGGARILVRSLLIDTDDGRQARNLVHIRPFHASEEVAGIGRESLYVASLPFGKDGVEGQGTLAGTRQSSDDGQTLARYRDINILQVVDASAQNLNFPLSAHSSPPAEPPSSDIRRVITLTSLRMWYSLPSAPRATTFTK